MCCFKILGTKAGEHFVNVARHGDGDNGGTRGVESNVHPEVLIAVGADGDFVVVECKCFFQVINVGLCSVSHAEIVDYQAEHDVAGAMAKQAWGVGALVITVTGKVLNQVDL